MSAGGCGGGDNDAASASAVGGYYVFFSELEIVLYLKLSASISNIYNINRTTTKTKAETFVQNVLCCHANKKKRKHNMYTKETEKAKSGSGFLLTFDCILYDRLRAYLLSTSTTPKREKV